MANEPQTLEGKEAARWIDEINLAEQALEEWHRSGDIIIRRYKNDERRNSAPRANRLRRYAILWSNVQTLKPAIYANAPVPVVTRRFRDEDAVAKVASEVLERALVYSLEAYDFDVRMNGVVDDVLLPGRGIVWVRYVPTMETVEAGDVDEDEGEADTSNAEDEPGEIEERVAYEEVLCDHVDWKDFLTNPAREYSEVRWGARRVFMTRKQLVKRFGEKVGNACPLDWAPKGHVDDNATDERVKRAAVYEIWDKDSREAIWVCKGYSSQVLDKRPDPLGLRDFFPFPMPLSATQAPGSFIPVPDYVLYQDQAEELDELTARIGKLQDALRMVGVYAGEANKELGRIFAPGNENKLIPIDTMDLWKEKGGVRGLIEWVPVDMVIQTLQGCYEARAQIINDIYQITGLSDIIRGAGDPNETATAQGIKAQWGSLRVRDRQKAVGRFARDVIRMKAEIIAEQFGVETLKQMTGVKLLTNDEKQQIGVMMQAQQAGLPVPPVQPEVMELMEQPSWEDVQGLLRDDKLRSFRIEIETDSTIEADETAAKQAFVEFTTATTGMLQAAATIVPSAPYVAPLFAEIMKEGARLFRVSRGMEDTIDKVFSQAEQMPPVQPEGPAQPPPPDPADEVKAQADMAKVQVEQARTQMEGQLGMVDAQLKARELDIKERALARDPTPQGTA